MLTRREITAEPYQRSVGKVSVAVEERGAKPCLARAYQAGSARLRITRRKPRYEVLTMNTAGGLAAGDHLALEARVSGGALAMSTVACERVYRAAGAEPAIITQEFFVARGARLAAVPQPTILYEDAALQRRTHVKAESGAAVVLCEGLVLGREAREETLNDVRVDDRLSVEIDGTLRLVDALRLTSRALARRDPAGLGTARGIGLVMAVTHNQDAALSRTREATQSLPHACAAASLVNGVLIARILAASHTALQDGLAQIVQTCHGEAVPRAWHL